jgi:ribosome-associated protein
MITSMVGPRRSRHAEGTVPPEGAAPSDGTAERPSKTQRKQQAHDLQKLGRELSELSRERLASITMDETLREAITALTRTRSHEGRRRQLQLVGKVMRQVDAQPLREALASTKLGSARESLALHRAEYWRDALVADEDAVSRFAAEHPTIELQALRQAVRRARDERAQRDAGASASPPPTSGAAPRQGRAWRDLYRLIRPAVDAAGEQAPAP